MCLYNYQIRSNVPKRRHSVILPVLSHLQVLTHFTFKIRSAEEENLILYKYNIFQYSIVGRTSQFELLKMLKFLGNYVWMVGFEIPHRSQGRRNFFSVGLVVISNNNIHIMSDHVIQHHSRGWVGSGVNHNNSYQPSAWELSDNCQARITSLDSNFWPH